MDFRRKICGWFVKTAFDVSSGIFWLDSFFYKNLRIFSPSSGCEENIMAFWRKAFKKFVKTAIYLYKKFLWKIWFLKKKLLQFFRVLIKNFATLAKMLSNRKTLSKVIFFLGKNSYLPTEVEGQGFWCSVRTSGRFVKTAFYVSKWDFRLNCFFYEFFEFGLCFPTVNRLFFNIGPKTLGKLSKAHSVWTRNFLRNVCFLKKLFTFTSFSSFDEKLCGHLSESVPPYLKKCFRHPFRGSSCITLSISSRKLTPTNGLWGKMFGSL